MESEQGRIAAALGVRSPIDVTAEAERRIAFLTELIDSSGAEALVVGISGGVDSAAVGALCRQAARRHPGRMFIAVRLPYGRQRDDRDAQLVLDSVQPHLTFTVDIQASTDATLQELLQAGVPLGSPSQQDFALGNVKARQRMIVQYAIANTHHGLVIGTDHAAEAVTGFFTKYGDGGVDANPLSGLTKRQVRSLAAHLNIPSPIITKVPTADLEALQPGRPDEDALGLRYEQIDDFLEGQPVDPQTLQTLLQLYRRTKHKRHGPRAPSRGV